MKNTSFTGSGGGRRRSIPAAAVLFLLGLPLLAQTQPSVRSAQALYVGQGLVLTASAPRQLTLNAHVPQFLYQPGGDSIAYVTVPGDGPASAVQFIDARSRHPDVRTIFTGDDAPALLGWSADGRYLLIYQDRHGYSCGDVGTEPLSSRPIEIGPSAADGAPYGPAYYAWSPRRRLLLFAQYAAPSRETHQSYRALAPAAPAFTLFDPARRTTRPLTPGDGLDVAGWLDEGHLLLARRPDAGTVPSAYLRYDLGTGAETEMGRARPSPLAPGGGLSFPYGLPADRAAPGNPDLTLEVRPQMLPDARQVAVTTASTVWVRSAKAPKAASVLSVGVTPGTDAPQAQWSPDGNAVAFVAHGDLFVAGLSERDATAREALAAGEAIDCDQERQVAADNLKQIGLAIIRRAQDDGGNYPAAGDITDDILPYLPDPGLLTLGPSRFVYRAPAALGLADMADPAGTVIGTMDVPCARGVLFADGHVQLYDRAGPPAP